MTTTRGREVDLEAMPPIPGIRARSFGGAADYGPVAELIATANAHDGIPWIPTAASLQVEWDSADGADPVDDVILVEVDGRVIAACSIERVVRDGVPNYQILGWVDPAFRRRGLGTALLAWNLRRARVRASREDPLTPADVTAFIEETETDHRTLITAAGFEPVRHFFLMRRDLADDVPDAPLPDGLETRPVTVEQWRTIFEAENEAFRDHWGHHEMGDAAFRATFDQPDLDTALWVVAWAGDEVAAVVENWVAEEENTRFGVKRGWLGRISVRAPWRRRGLGRAVTAASLVKLREAGLEEAMLGVDSENANGALGLYEGLGFVVHLRSEAYRRRLER